MVREERIAPSLKLTVEDEFPFGARPIFRGELLVFGGVYPLLHVKMSTRSNREIERLNLAKLYCWNGRNRRKWRTAVEMEEIVCL